MAVKKFIKFDSEKGYLDNKDDINYFASELMRKVAFGKMLGDFDENGLYVINQKIVEELIKMPKVIVEVLDDADLIRSKVKADSFFHFILTIEDNKVSFKLLEKIHYQSNKDFNSGAYSNINEYVIDEVIVQDRDFDRNALYEKYNISVDNDGEVLSIFDMDELSLALYYNIIEKLKTDYLVQNELILKEKELESIEADYFEAILAVLSQYAEFGDKVVSSVKKDLAEKHNFVIVSKPFFQKTINEIIDNYIDFYIQDLLPDQKEEVLAQIREIKAQYYQKFKALMPIQIAQKAGVRFDTTQIVQEGIIDGLVQQIETKGFTSSDVRKILINEDELKLSLAKIIEMVKENEEICKRDNTKAKDITKGRDLTTKFYKDLEKEKQVDMLKPSLIKSAIDEKSSKKVDEKAQINNTQKLNISTATNAAKAGKGNVVKGGANVKGASKPQKGVAKAKAGGKKPGATKSANASTTATPTKSNKVTSKTILYGVGTGSVKQSTKEGVANNIFEELLDDDHGTAREVTRTKPTETQAHSNVADLMK